jgi:hypothetical protein
MFFNIFDKILNKKHGRLIIELTWFIFCPAMTAWSWYSFFSGPQYFWWLPEVRISPSFILFGAILFSFISALTIVYWIALFFFSHLRRNVLKKEGKKYV